MDTNDTYKDVKTQFVSGHKGTSVLEIAIIVSIAPLSVFLRNLTLSWLYRKKPIGFWTKLLWDFSMLVLPGLASVTFLSSNLSTIYSTMFFIIGAVLVFCGTGTLAPRTQKTWDALWVIPLPEKKPFIAWFRAYVNICTAVSILAVDFPVFPRRLAKTETWGTGLMDAGVGAFVIANALVSPEARGKYMQTRTLKEKCKNILKEIKSTLPLWILGLARLAAVKSVDYHEHVTEYGVHWNFFFTLAIVRVLYSLLRLIANPGIIICIVVAAFYQYMVLTPEFVSFMLDAPRTNLYLANREGIFSSVGYLFLYICGVGMGTHLFYPRKTFADWYRGFAAVAWRAALSWVTFHFSVWYFDQETSRRLVNLPYILWMLAYCYQLLALFLLIDLVFTVMDHYKFLKRGNTDAPFCLAEAVNKNGLFYFLLANVLTGCVNVTMDTVNMPDLPAMMVLTGYLLLISVTTAGLYVKNVTLKFW